MWSVEVCALCETLLYLSPTVPRCRLGGRHADHTHKEPCTKIGPRRAGTIVHSFFLPISQSTQYFTLTTPTKNPAQRPQGGDLFLFTHLLVEVSVLFIYFTSLYSDLSERGVRKISKGFIAIFVMRQPELETLEPKSRRGPSQPHTRTYQMLASRMRSDPEHLTLQHTLHPRCCRMA